jgi:hypothetical protein
VAVQLKDGSKFELRQVPWRIILDYALRLLPLLGAALPATLVVADSYASGYAQYFRIPDEFVRVSAREAIAPFTWALVIVVFLLWFAHQVQMFGAMANNSNLSHSPSGPPFYYLR